MVLATVEPINRTFFHREEVDVCGWRAESLCYRAGPCAHTPNVPW